LYESKLRLGDIKYQRDKTKFIEIWQDGSEKRKIQMRLQQIQEIKADLEKEKKSIKSRKGGFFPETDKLNL